MDSIVLNLNENYCGNMQRQDNLYIILNFKFVFKCKFF